VPDGSAEAVLDVMPKVKTPEDVSEFPLTKAIVGLLEVEALRLDVGCGIEDVTERVSGNNSFGDATDPWRVLGTSSEGSGLDGAFNETGEGIGRDSMVSAGWMC